MWITGSFAKNSAGVPEIIDTNNYYPFGLNHISGSFSTSGFGSFYSYKYNGKELQENGMYDYGARMYMPDLGRWGTTDPLAEAFRRFSPYHYGADNPVMFVDPDGMRSVPCDGGIISNVPEGSFWFAGMNGSFISTPEFKQGSRTGGSSTQGTFGNTQAYRDLMLATQNGGDFSLKTNNGYMSWWTDGDELGYGRIVDGKLEFGVQELVVHRMKLNAGTPWDAYKNWADWGASTAGGGFKYLADRRTALYNSGYWIDNLGQMRSTAYAGRARGSLIGLRGDYVRHTEMLGKYAKRAGYVGYGISAAQIGYGMYKDDWKFGVRAQIATANVAGGMAGAAAGAWALGKVGGFIGTLVGPEGTIIGAAVGGIVGGIVGGVWGGDIAEGWASNVLNKADY